MRKSNKKKKYDQRKRTKRILKFLRDNATIITILITLLAALFNGILAYYRKSTSTEFYFQYLTVKVDREDWVKTYQKEDYGSYFQDALNAPTVNNELNQLLYQSSDKTVGYFVTYLIMKQRGDVDAQDVKIHFKQYGTFESLGERLLNEFSVDEDIISDIETKIEYPFPKDEQVKIPISICKTENHYTVVPQDCYNIRLEPISIEYKNNYLFSKRNIPIRKYLEHNVIIDGQVVTGKGGISEEENQKEWYLK